MFVWLLSFIALSLTHNKFSRVKRVYIIEKLLAKLVLIHRKEPHQTKDPIKVIKCIIDGQSNTRRYKWLFSKWKGYNWLFYKIYGPYVNISFNNMEWRITFASLNFIKILKYKYNLLN